MRRVLGKLAAVALGAWLAACGGDGGGGTETCTSDQQCGAGELCLQLACYLATGDADHDGLSNQWEQAHFTNPLSADSDGDGRADLDEVGDPNAPTDSDGDGKIDALESATKDSDDDGLADQNDPNDDQADYPRTFHDAEHKATLYCTSPTVCKVTACDPGWSNVNSNALDGCEYPCVAASPPDEVCNHADDDCDGLTDEALADCGCLEGADPAAETCNGRDDDCDGAVDEDLAACRCRDGQAPLEVELCNRVDDDCNGLVDEGVARCACQDGKPGQAQEQCNGLDDDCNDAVDDLPHCGCAGGAAPREETCNGVDDDCDGTIDDNLEPELAPCPDLGVCAGMSLNAACQGEAGWQCDFSALGQLFEPEEATCDHLDNDCDGLTDETLAACACADGGQPAGAEVCNGVDDDCEGQVDQGLERCACTGGAPPTGETCNWRDDDCDGMVDEFLEDCRCMGDVAPLATEACNGLDDDCNGAVDDGLAAPDSNCLGFGVCAGMAGATCQGALGWKCDYASVEGFEAVEATCDNRDNDCDGATDEGLPTCGCSDGGEPTAEVCNGLDDDCDGLVDEGLGVEDSTCPRWGVCLGKVTALCQGVQGWGCYYAGIPGYQPVEQACDRLDNDCDGATDEAVVDCGCASGPPGPETCNHVDDDCNGQIDEGLLHCRCANGALVPAPETCNTVDDDCNGQVDDLPACRCTGGVAPLGFEQCNAIDDNCNGQVDEGLNLGAACLIQAYQTCSLQDCNLMGVRACDDGGGGEVTCALDEPYAPDLIKLEPASGPSAGGTVIQLTGSGFLCGLSVFVGDVPCTSSAMEGPTQACCKVPPGSAGAKSLRLVNPDGQEALLNPGFSYF
jgi:hypothetical protein